MSLGIQSSPLRVLFACGLIAVSSLTSLAEGPATQPADNPPATRALLAQNYGKIPLSFQANHGQADKTVKFLSNGRGYSLFLTDSSAVLALTKPEVSNAKSGLANGKGLKPASAHPARKTDIVRMDLAGANRAMQVTASDPLPGTANYFIGNDPARWHTGVPTFAKVKYAGVYPGIDLVYYGNQRQLEYDFVVAPGANPKPIRLEFAGAKTLKLSAEGDLTVSAANGQIAFHKPVVYQVADGLRQPVDGQFALLKKNSIGFTLGRYDHSKPLVIDPVLSYSTYLGGTLADGAYGIAADSSGNAYVVGPTFSTNFPVTAGAFQSTNNEPPNSGFECVFVSKLNPTGTALVYSTYLGGSGNPGNHAIYGDVGNGIAVDSSGDAYVTGDADSTDFPVTTGAFQTTNNSTKVDTQNAFVTKLNPTGTALLYSTYLGGNNQDYGSGIAVDSFDYAYVTGYTSSSTFPVTAGAFQANNNSDLTDGWFNVFVTKLNQTGAALVYSTYLGGSLYGARGQGIAVDSSGDAYVTGSAASQDFPTTTGAFQITNKAVAAAGPNPSVPVYNAFVSKLNPTGTALDYSTFLGGSIDDYSAGIALDGSGDAYVTGQSWSNDFPVAGSAFQSTNNGYANDGFNAFVTEVNSAGTGLVYSTFLGGTGLPSQASNESGAGDSANAIAVDPLGDAYVTGSAISTNFPTTSGAYQTVNNAAGSTSPIGINAFITKLNPSGSSLLYSTYLGGTVQDYGTGIALDGVGGVYVAGLASSTNFPTTTGAYQPANAGNQDAFIAKLAIGYVPSAIATTTSLTSSANPQVLASSITFTATVTPESGTNVPTGNVIFSVDGTSVDTVALDGTGEATYLTSSLTTGPHTILASYDGSSAYTASSDSLTETISQPLASTTTSIAQSGSPGNYTLTATVVGSGSLPAAPTGTVSFLDTSNGNAVVATATLGTGTAGALTWTNTQTPATEPAPQSIVVGDFNGDAIPDIAAGSNGYVSVLIGKGDGTFKAASNLAALSNNQWMAAAAFVTGGPTGILTVSNSASSTNNARLILGNGSGGETVEAPFSLPCGSASAVVTGDFNGDGKPDFLVACQDSGAPVFAVFLGNGNGTFAAPTITPIGSAILAIGVGNFRGNGKTDIAVVTAISGTSDMQTISVFENDGSGNFSPGPSVTSTGMSPTSMVVADFNGDGKADLALLNSAGNNVSIMLSAGNGTFTQAASPQTGSSPSSIAVGDFNGDGVPDLAVANGGGNTVTILLGKGDGTFTAAATPPTGNTPSALAVGDFITGGKLGLAVANSAATGGSVTVLNQLTAQSATATATGVSPSGSGAHLVEASYPGDANYAASVSGTTSLSGSAQVAVPNVVGDTQAAATTAITGAGLVVGTVTTASSATVASGKVISESPVAGTSVNSGSAVNLVVSTGPAQVAVPNVVGDTQAAATTAITGAGLVVGTVTTASSATVASGKVISESPSAGTSVNSGSAVNLVVSTGPAQVAVPNVVGDTQAAATTAITGAGLVVGTVTTASSATVASGKVISESPSAGTTVNSGSAVNLVVSTGPAQVAVPNVVGDTQAAATTAITGAGLVVGTVTTASSATVASGKVISESPSAGTSVNSGSAVNLVVSTGPAQVAVPNVVGDTQAAATTAITGAGLVVGTVTTASSATVASGKVISESPVAGTSVKSGSAVNLVVSTGPAQVAVPNVVGDTQAAATTAITGAGLVVGTVTTASSATVASGKVISESPVAGTSVNSGSAVNLVVSTGPAQMSSAATPVFSPAAGSYTSTQSVTITDSTTGAAIYYTTSGNPPTTSSTKYTAAISVSASETIEAIAVASGYTNSAVATANYVIVVPAPGYTLSANPPSLTIKSGSTGTTVITVTPTGGFTGTVNFSCGALPPEVTCSFSPASLTVASGGAAPTTTLTVGTTGTATASLRDGPSGTLLPGIFVAMILLPLGFTRRILRVRKTGSPWLICLLLLATASLAAAGMLGLAGCGGKSSSSTPAGNYSIPISVTSGGTTVPLNLSITVQ